ALLAGGEIAVHIAVVLATIRLRHQHGHVLAGDAGFLIAEQSLGSRAERLDGPLLVDNDGRIGNRVEDRAEMRFARPQILRMAQVANAREAKLLAEPGDTDADNGEDDGLEHRGLREMAAPYKQDAERDAQRRGEQPWT